MALIIYLTKAPRYKNIYTDQYETIPREDIELIDRYFNWKRVRSEGRDAGDTLEEWCGIPESKLAHKYIVNYYREFYGLKQWYAEYIGDVEGYSIFDQLARIAKANQIFNWFIKNVMNGNADKAYHEVAKTQLKDLLNACKNVKAGCTLCGINQDGEAEYVVNESIAKKYVPLMDKTGYFFGTDQYGSIYAKQIISFIDILKDILENTDFEKETVYFNATW